MSTDNRFNEISKDNQILQEKHKKCQEQLEIAEKYASELRCQLDESRKDVQRLQESIKM